MTDPDLEVPSWVVRMREAGSDVRIGTGGLPEEPEFTFTLPPTRRATLRRRVKSIARKLWQRGNGRPSIIRSDPEILGGTPVFVGTRVPLKALIDYVKGEHLLAEFLDDFPTVTREQVLSVLDEAEEALSQRAPGYLRG